MRQNSRFAVIFIAALVLFSCTDKRVVENLDYVDSIMQEEPERALEVLDSISKSDLKSGRVKARYALLYSMALDKNYIDTTDVSVIRDAQKYYSRKGSDRDKMLMYYYLGRIHFNAGQYDEAIVCYEQAKEHGLRTEEYAYIGRVYIGFAKVYSNSYNYQKEYEYICLAEESFIKSGNERLASAAMCSKAEALLELDQQEEAIHISEKLLNSSNHDIRLESMISLATIHENLGNYDQSLKYFNFAIEENYDFSPAQYCIYAYVLSKTGDEEEGYRILSEVERLDSDQKVVAVWYKTRIAEETGDYKTAFKLYENVVNVQDSIVNETLRNSTEQARREYYEHQSIVYKEQSKNKSLMIIVLCLASALVVVILVLLMYVQHKKSELKSNNLLSMIETANVRLRQSDKELSDVKQKMVDEYLSLHREQFSKLGRIAETFVSEKGNVSGGLYRKMKDLMSEIIGDDKSHARFEQEVNTIFDNVMKHYREDYPGLPDNDYLFMAFIFSGFDATSISMIMNISSIGAVYMRKSRIKKTIAKSNSPHKGQFLALL